MERIHEEYETIYNVLKSRGVEILEDLELAEHSKDEIRKRIRRLPHPDVATLYDIREVCKELREEQLYEFHHLVREEVETILSQLEDEQFDYDFQPSHEDELAAVKHQLNRQTKMLEVINFRSRQASQGVDRTLKSNCRQCGSDLKIYVDQSGSQDELMLSCRNCNNEWSIQFVR